MQSTKKKIGKYDMETWPKYITILGYIVINIRVITDVEELVQHKQQNLISNKSFQKT